jgi:DNA-binding GntR family transcriptional regulator
MSEPAVLKIGPDHANGQPLLSLQERAYLELRDQIIRLELPPGALLNEDELMQSLGVGRTPIRDAIKRLHYERLVVILPRRGTLVTEVTITQLALLTEVRVPNEGSAASLAAARATDAERERCQSLIAELAKVDKHTPHTRVFELDRDVHELVYQAAHNQFLEDTLREQYNLSLRLWYLVLDRVPRSAEIVRDHRELLNAIGRGRSPQAQEIAQEHVREFERAIRAAI